MLTLAEALHLSPVRIIFIGTENEFWTLSEDTVINIGSRAREVEINFASTGEDALKLAWTNVSPTEQKTVIYGLLSWLERHKSTRSDMITRYFGAFASAGLEIRFGDSHSSPLVDSLLQYSSS